MFHKWTSSTKPQEEPMKKPNRELEERSRGESSKGSYERGAKEAPAPAGEAAWGAALELSWATEPRERPSQPPPVVLKVILIPPSPEAGTTAEPKRVLTPSMASIVAGVQQSGPASIDPSSLWSQPSKWPGFLQWCHPMHRSPSMLAWSRGY